MSTADLWERFRIAPWVKLHTRIGRYVFAVLAVAAATVLRFGLQQLLGPFHPTFILFYPTVVIVAMMAGFGPGILASALGAVSGGYFFLEPRFSFTVRTPEDVVGPALFAFIGVFLTILTHSRTEAQQALRENDDRYRDLVEHSEDLVCTHDLEGRLLSVNPAPARLLGYELAELLKIPMRELIAPEFREQFDEYLARIKKNRADKGLLCVVTRSGERRIWEYDNKVSTEGLASPIVRGMARDVTEQKRAEAALRESEERYRMLFEKGIAGVAITSLEGEILDCNETWAHMLGYVNPAEARGLPIGEHYGRAGVREAVLDELKRTGGLSNWEVEFRHKDGTLIWVLSNAILIQGESGPAIQSTIVDITAQKQAEQALRRREQEYRTLLDNIPDVIVRYDKDSRRIYVNPAWERASGFAAKDVIGVPITDIAGLPLSVEYVEKLGCVIETGTPQSVELSWTSARGEERFHRCIIVPDYDRSGNIVGALAVGRDETGLRRAEEALRRREQDYRTLLDNIPDLIVRYDMDFCRTFVNPAWERASGFAAKDVIGVPITDIGWAPGSDEYLKRLRRVLETGTPQTVEFSWTNARGEELFLGYTIVPEFDHSGNLVGAVGVGYDRTPVMRAGRERAANLHFFESMDRVNRAILGTDDLQQMMNDVLDTVLSIFDCDRAFLLYPCDPEAKTWTAPIERTRPEYPGAASTVGSMPMDGQVAQTFRILLSSDGPVKFGPEGAHPLPSAVANQFHIQSFMSMALYPRTGMPWQFGIHSCSRPRAWTDEEAKLFDAIGRRVSDALSSFLAHRNLQESENKLAEAQRIAHVGYWDYDVDADRVEWSEENCRIHGFSPEEHTLTRGRVQELIPPEDWPMVEKALAEVFRNGQHYEVEHRVVRPDGEVRFIHAHGNVIRNESGRPVRMFGTVQDITEPKQAEEALRQSDERFRVALQDSPITVFSQDQDLRYTWIHNPCFRSPEEIIGRTDDEVIEREEAAHLRRLKRGVLETGEAARAEIVVTQGGKKRAYDMTLEPLRDANGKIIGITGTYVDIARLRELADSLQTAKDRLVQEKQYLENEIRADLGFEEIIGQSPALHEVLKQTRVVAPTDSTVLLLGETGTGKELVARAVHALSGRAEKSFIKLNCAAVPTGLLESELFGHEKGAFTSAVSQKIGRLELADRGTLFLDEVGELPLELQPKLLRVLQDREFERLGGVRTLRVDVRIISATNRDLRTDVAAKRFREDLFYRLNVFPISLPSLRERRSDIPLLVRHFVQKYAARMGKHIETIPDESMRVLEDWSWPGNIRELENMIERMVILTKGSVLAAPPIELEAAKERPNGNLSEMERDYIIRILQETNGVLSGSQGAASRLGVKRTTLQSMLKRFGIEPEEFRRREGTYDD